MPLLDSRPFLDSAVRGLLLVLCPIGLAVGTRSSLKIIDYSFSNTTITDTTSTWSKWNTFGAWPSSISLGQLNSSNFDDGARDLPFDPLPFCAPFYSLPSAPFFVSPNGFIAVTPTPMCAYALDDKQNFHRYCSNPDQGYYKVFQNSSGVFGGNFPLIGLFVEDLNPADKIVKGNISAWIDIGKYGSMDALIVSFSRVVIYNTNSDSPPPLEAQVEIIANGTIIFRYRQVFDPSVFTSLPVPFVGLVWTNSQRTIARFPRSGSAYRFDPVPDPCDSHQSCEDCIAAVRDCVWCASVERCVTKAFTNEGEYCSRTDQRDTQCSLPELTLEKYSIGVSYDSDPDAWYAQPLNFIPLQNPYSTNVGTCNIAPPVNTTNFTFPFYESATKNLTSADMSSINCVFKCFGYAGTARGCSVDNEILKKTVLGNVISPFMAQLDTRFGQVGYAIVRNANRSSLLIRWLDCPINKFIFKGDYFLAATELFTFLVDIRSDGRVLFRYYGSTVDTPRLWYQLNSTQTYTKTAPAVTARQIFNKSSFYGAKCGANSFFYSWPTPKIGLYNGSISNTLHWNTLRPGMTVTFSRLNNTCATDCKTTCNTTSRTCVCGCGNGICNNGTLSDGTCWKCSAGVAGRKCDINCTCNPLQGECDGVDGVGLCKVGRYNQTRFVSEGRCQSVAFNGTDCRLCSSGYYGAECYPCKCQANRICFDGIRGNGSCGDCKRGWAGDSCDVCSMGYYGPQCLKCLCDDGTCFDGLSGNGPLLETLNYKYISLNQYLQVTMQEDRDFILKCIGGSGELVNEVIGELRGAISSIENGKNLANQNVNDQKFTQKFKKDNESMIIRNIICKPKISKREQAQHVVLLTEMNASHGITQRMEFSITNSDSDEQLRSMNHVFKEVTHMAKVETLKELWKVSEQYTGVLFTKTEHQLSAQSKALDCLISLLLDYEYPYTLEERKALRDDHLDPDWILPFTYEHRERLRETNNPDVFDTVYIPGSLARCYESPLFNTCIEKIRKGDVEYAEFLSLYKKWEDQRFSGLCDPEHDVYCKELAKMLGDSCYAVFDENHSGTMENTHLKRNAENWRFVLKGLTAVRDWLKSNASEALKIEKDVLVHPIDRQAQKRMNQEDPWSNKSS